MAQSRMVIRFSLRLFLISNQVLHSGFHVRRAETYKDLQSLESRVTMYQLLTDPEHWEQHLQRLAIPSSHSRALITFGRRKVCCECRCRCDIWTQSQER